MCSKIKHLDLLKAKGQFKIDCNNAIFSDEEVEILKKYGHWFQALTNGDLDPITPEQVRFVEVARNSETPTTIFERAWFKYLGRKRLEFEMGERLNVHYELEEDTFYNRAMVNHLRKTVFRVITENHKP